MTGRPFDICFCSLALTSDLWTCRSLQHLLTGIACRRVDDSVAADCIQEEVKYFPGVDAGITLLHLLGMFEEDWPVAKSQSRHFHLTE